MYVVVVENDQKKKYVQVDQNTGKGIPVDDPKDATKLDKMASKIFLRIVKPVIKDAQPGVKVYVEGV